MSYDIRTCRYCNKRAHTGWLIKYGTRAYAHPQCYYAYKTAADIARLPSFERARLETWVREEKRKLEIDGAAPAKGRPAPSAAPGSKGIKNPEGAHGEDRS